VADSKLIVNLTRGNVVCDQVTVADRPLRRMRGLMGRRELPPRAGMLLRPAPAIHSAFMRFALDALFLDVDLRVLRAVDELRPWRAAAQRGAHAVLELAAGERARCGAEVGDRLALLDGPTEVLAWRMDGASDSDRGAALSPSPPRSPHTGDPMRVLLVAPDRRFRQTASLLLVRRGCVVSVADSAEQALELAGRDNAEVIVLDAGRSLTEAARNVATLQALSPPVGVVVVADEAEQGLLDLPVLDRWGSFEALYAAVEDAHRGRTQRRSLVERG
jgi:uncharacterized membrane protein (UPF0127 family)/CheY-like chemotaxis protein